MRPFQSSDTYSAFQSIKQKLRNEIANLKNEYVLNVSVTELEQHYIDKGTLDPFVLHADQRSIVSQSGTSIDVSNDFNRAGARRGRQIHVPGTELTIGIPCDGDPDLLKLQPSTNA